MANDESETDTDTDTDTGAYFEEETRELFEESGIHYSPDPSRVFNRRKGLHFSVNDGVGVLNVGGSTRMIQGYDETGPDAVADVLERAAEIVR